MKKILLSIIAMVALQFTQAQTLNFLASNDTIFVGSEIEFTNNSSGYNSYLINFDECEIAEELPSSLCDDHALADTISHFFWFQKPYNIKLYGLNSEGDKLDSTTISVLVKTRNHTSSSSLTPPPDTCACNHVYNGSFETSNINPTVQGALGLINNWEHGVPNSSVFGFANASSDIYMTGTPNVPAFMGASAPMNRYGWENPYNFGTAYAGIHCHSNTFNILTQTGYRNREYLVQSLGGCNLVAGQEYKASMQVSLADASQLFVDQLGMYFGPNHVTTAGYGYTNQMVMQFGGAFVNPQVEMTTPITSSSGWNEISGTFIATGNEEAVHIGNFANNANTTVGTNTTAVQINPADPNTAIKPTAYYYIDEIKITPVPSLSATDTIICEDNSVTLTIENPIVFNNTDFYYDWSNGATTSSITVNQGGGYSVIISNDDCVIDTLSIFIYECCDAMNSNADWYYYDGAIAQDIINDNSSFGSLITGKTIAINGTFHCDQDLTFKNCTLLMGPYANIEVTNGATLEIFKQSLVKACTDVMWKTIDVFPSCTISVRGRSKIRDGINAINCQDNSMFTLRESYFEDNYTSLTTNDNVNPASSVIYTQFYSTNYLLTPYSYKQQGHCGIDIQNTQQLYIGNGLGFTFTNTFNTLDFGIIVENSSVDIMNNNFYNIWANSTSEPHLVNGFNVRPGKAIYAESNSAVTTNLNVGNSNAYNKNSFNHCLEGIIVTDNINTSIRANDLYDSKLGISVSYCSEKTIHIIDNLVQQMSTGIQTYLNACSNLLISENDVLNMRTGINCNEIDNSYISCSMVPSNNFGVVNNCISEVNIGINMFKCYNGNVSYNAIQEINPLPMGLGGQGLNMYYGEGHNVTNNYIEANNLSPNISCIKAEWCRTRSISCNELRNAENCLYFIGQSYSRTSNNSMHNSRNGFHLDGNLTEIGTQGNPFPFPSGTASDNRWYGFNTFLPHTYCSNGADGNLSPFYVRSTFAPFYPQFNNIAGSSFPIAIATVSANPILFNCELPANCGILLGPGPGPSHTPYLLAESMEESIDSNNTTTLTTEEIYLTKTSVYETVKNDTSIQTASTELTDFMIEEEETEIGTLTEVKEAVSKDSVEISQATQLVDTLVTSNMIAETEKTLYSILLNRLNNGQTEMQFNSAEKQIVEDIAWLCPDTYGSVVYKARSVMHYIDTTYINYANSCEVGTPNSGARFAHTNTAQEELLLIYPNPAISNITISISIEDKEAFLELQLINSLGQVLETHSVFSQGEVNLDVSSLATGVYFINLADQEGNIIATKKLTKE